MLLLTMMAFVAVGVVRLRNLFAVVILSSIYSFLMASVLIVLDAVDVAMTEAAVGAGVSTVLMLAALYLTKVEEAAPRHSPLLPMFVAVVVGAALLYGAADMPPFGEANTAMNAYVGAGYLARSVPETGIPNVVSSVLASYRGYDTAGETVVVFTAGIGVLLLLRRNVRSRSKD
jgi:multicomponent Na+:H+ antiporter subunit B